MKDRYRRTTLNGKTVKIHRLIMEEYLGRPLERWEVVHHCNGDGHDNRIENLELMSLPEHVSLHNTGKTQYTANSRKKIQQKRREIVDERLQRGVVWCSGHKKELPSNLFGRSSGTYSGYHSLCKECVAETWQKGKPHRRRKKLPIFEYLCTDCGNKFEYLHMKSTTEPEDEIITCAVCGGYHILQVPSAPAIAKLATPAYGN